MPRIACPNCNTGYEVPDAAVGKSVTCKKCGQRFDLRPDQPVQADDDPMPRPQLITSGLPSPVVVRIEQPESERSVQASHRMRGSFGTGFGLTSGCLAALLFFVVGVPILVCGGIALIARLGPNAEREFAERATIEQQATQAVPTRQLATFAPSTAPKQEAIAPARKLAREGPMRIGLVTVSVPPAVVGKVPLVNLFREQTVSVDSLFIVNVKIEVLDVTKKYNYYSWAGRSLRSDARLTDNFGNRYKAIDFGTSKPSGRVESESVTAENPITDVLVFEPPLKAVRYLDLDLPGANVGVDGTFLFRLEPQLEADVRPKPQSKSNPFNDRPDPPKPSADEEQARKRLAEGGRERLREGENRVANAPPAPGPTENPSTATEPTPPARRDRDPKFDVSLAGSKTRPVVLAQNAETLDLYLKAVNSKNDKVTARMIDLGQVVRLEDSVGVLVEYRGQRTATVRPVDGPHAGKSWSVQIADVPAK